jgi:hypothetical protein
LTKANFDALTNEIATLKESVKTVTTESITRKGKNKKLEGELEALRKAKADGTTDADDKGKQYQTMFDGFKSEIADLTGKLRDRDVFGKISSIAHKHGAINPDDVVTLMKGNITFDDKGDTVIMGGKVNGTTGKPYSLDEFTTEFLAGRQHLIKASGNSGAGSTNSAGSAGGNGKTYTPEQIGKMTQDQYEQARKENNGLPPI